MNPYQHGQSAQAAGSGLRRSGVHGLFRLDEGPIDPDDAVRLGLDAVRSGAGILEAFDPVEPWAGTSAVEDACTTCLAGWIDDAAMIAERLGLSPGSSPARIARAALDRYGAETPLQLSGEWTLLQWDRRAGRAAVTIMASAARRDPVLYAQAGARLAVSSDLYALARIGWVDSELDETGLLAGMGRPAARAMAPGRTIYRGVARLGPGQGLVFRAGASPKALHCDPLALPPPWPGTAEEALAEAEALLRQIMRERIARAGSAAMLLSGGLDSTLLSWAAATEADPASNLITFTSAAPPGCAVRDETNEARLVADSLGLANLPIVVGPEHDSYRPPARVLAGANGPPLGNRHCLTEAFQQVARQHGINLLVNGTYGEGTLTARLEKPGPLSIIRRFAKRLLGRTEGPSLLQAGDWFHVQLATHRLAKLPPELAARPEPAKPDAHHGQFGFQPVAAKALAHPNAFYAGAVRMDFPFRDLRLLRFFAGLPTGTVSSLGADRGAARRMLAGRVPAAIVDRRAGRPADPGGYDRLQRQAPTARARIAGYRKAGLDAWLDLDWLELELTRVASHGVSGVDQANRTQLTAMTAEYLQWLQDGAKS
ncbi:MULTISPECIES: asparagine synthase-related protein [unclassified Novosphingobium]|uniref:asparagine synthase-related protein n=1 Tax=unclassified Novosphingobium TaxID=2644732 RepID=UPI000EE611CE|nr:MULTISPECIES: asparagine synthase-related protein [unclassified Novosphingobium]HCF25119.1 hypothetical protein [Novosphingobium sp.]HQV02260.1 asparagine synthase-related protein [Novosphingobium sp.]